jgi:hypothetical protein
MSKGNPQAGGSTSGFGSQGQFGQGYAGGSYDPMLGFGQSSGMGTSFDYPTRYSADYTRYAQSGQPFNQPVMGYNTYGQIFAQPQRPPPTMGGKGGSKFQPQPPSMGGKGGGGFQPSYGGFQPGYRYQPTQQPPTMGGKGGPQPENDGVTISYPGGSRTVPRSPERRTRQLGLNNNQQAPAVDQFDPNLFNQVGPGQTPPQELRSFTGGFGNNEPSPMFGGGFGLGGMPTGGPQIDPNYTPVMGDRNFDMSPTVVPDNYIPRFGNMMYFQEGGQIPPDAAANMEMMLAEAPPADPQAEMAGEYDRLIQMTMQAILGQVENADEVIQMFIDEFGVDAFRQLRDAVLKQQAPGAQTEGLVDGNGGGMDDQVMGMIGNQRPVAVSPGEYIVPADVVSGLGDGSSKSGADILDELNQAVRMARTGTTEQPRPLMETMQQ